MIPFTRACDSRSSTGALRQASSFTITFPLVLMVSANSTNLSVASVRRLSKTSSTSSNKSFGISSYTSSIPAFTMPMSRPALMAWYKKAECMASRTTLFPRKEKEILETPPLTLANGRFCLIQRVASIKSTA